MCGIPHAVSHCEYRKTTQNNPRRINPLSRYAPARQPPPCYPPSRMPKKSTSSKRIAANRANATRSTGPRTPEGKTRSAQNARKHGFTASKFVVVRLEKLDSLANLRDDAVAAYQPQNSQELFAVERIALAQHALLRCAALEAGLHTEAMNEICHLDDEPRNLLTPELTQDIEATRLQNRSYVLAVGFRRVIRKSDAWKLFLRYQAQTERLYRRAIEDFERLRAMRNQLPNEPNVQSEIEEIKLIEPDILVPPDGPEDEINGFPPLSDGPAAPNPGAS